jgi:hypothetical protein
MKTEWVMVRVTKQVHEMLLGEKAMIESQQELGKYPHIEAHDKHGVTMTEVIRHSLNELKDHRTRSRQSAIRRAQEIIAEGELLAAESRNVK